MVERSLSMREAPGSIPGFSSMKISTSKEEDSLVLQVFVFHLCVPAFYYLTAVRQPYLPILVFFEK